MLKETRKRYAGEGFDPADINAYLHISRLASQASLLGTEATETLAADWEQLDDAQRLLTVMLARLAPSSVIRPQLESCTGPENSYQLRAVATEALGVVGGDGVAALLKTLLDDDNDLVRKYAFSALGESDSDIELIEQQFQDLNPCIPDSEWVSRLPGSP